MSNFKHTPEQLREAVKDSFSIAEVLRKLELNPYGSNYSTIQKRFKEHDIDISHFTGQGYAKGKTYPPRPVIAMTDILSGNVQYVNSNRLRLRLISEGIFQHKCYNCNLTEWLGDPIPLELEHIDGNHANNKLENLTLLCPNCHTKTLTYRGKNKNK
jgi:5-methylcytosine-specific restriction endonuclease McrA